MTIYLAWVLLTAMGCGNSPPVLMSLQNQTIETGKQLKMSIIARDDDGDRLAFGIEGAPPGARLVSLNKNTAEFTWTPDRDDAGLDGGGKDYHLLFKASDGEATATTSVIITVILGDDEGNAPQFVPPFDYELDLYKSSYIQFEINVSDTDSPQVFLTLTRSIAGMDFDYAWGSKQAEVTWQPSAAQIAADNVYVLAVQADDGEFPAVIKEYTILLTNRF
jgi:hypothetical protein